MARKKTRTPPRKERWRPTWNAKLIYLDMTVAGHNQTTLALKAGVTQMTVSRVLARQPSVSQRQVAKIATALGQPLERYIEDVVWEGEPGTIRPSVA